MRTKYAVVNGIWALFAWAITAFFSLFNRKLLLQCCSETLIAYHGVFSSIFLLLNISELGTGVIISYKLYQAIEQEDKENISQLMGIYKWLYRCIGIIIGVFGLFLLPFLKYLVSREMFLAKDVYFLYLMLLANLVLTYFISYKRLMFMCDQKGYVCMRCDALFGGINGIASFFIIVYTKNFYLYILVGIFTYIFSNIFISIRYNKQYSYIRKYHFDFRDLKRQNIFKDIKDYLVHRIANAVYGGTDNIVSSKLLGASFVVKYTNYTNVESHVTSVLDRTMSGLEAGVGNFVYDKTEKNKEDLFQILNDIGYFLAVFVSASYLVLFQPFISFWFGGIYILPFGFVLFFSLNQYIAWNHRMISYFRQSLGNYDYDKSYMVIGALLNVIMSVILTIKMGATGLVLATFVSHIVIWYGRGKTVFHKLFHEKKYKEYWLNQLVRAIWLLIVLFTTYFLAKLVPNTKLSLLFEMMICVLVPNILNVILFHKSKGMVYIRESVQRLYIKRQGRGK